jgi:FSR family fosmidomycin resistance protein-like MFS transporter
MEELGRPSFMNAPSRALDVPTRSRWAGLAPGVATALLFCFAHFFIDLYSGALGIFQPVLVNRLGMTLTQAGLLGGLLVFSSSVTQPLYGYLSDRYRSRLFSALAPAVAGVFICALPWASSYQTALLLVLLGGAGVSSFHPQGSSWATARIESHRTLWMAVFISSGTMGIALAPAAFSWIIQHHGFEQVAWAAVPGLAATALLLAFVRPPVSSGRTASFSWKPLRVVWKPLTLLYLAVVFRSAVQVTFTQFLALYLHRERGYSLQQAAWILSTYVASGAIGGIVGGRLADRFGARQVIMNSFLFSVPCMAVFFAFPGPAGVMTLALGGLILLFTIPVNVVVAQDLAPGSAGTVSALMMGFAWGTAGIIFIPWTGWLSDRTSLHFALSTLLIWPVLGYFLTRLLPEDLGR